MVFKKKQQSALFWGDDGVRGMQQVLMMLGHFPTMSEFEKINDDGVQEKQQSA